MDLHLTDRVAVVTGGSKGIGRSIALGLATEGAHIATCARSATALEATAAELRATGVRVHTAVCDVGDPTALDAFLTGAHHALGRVDILVNNVSAIGVDDDEASWQGGFDVDVMASVRAAWKVVPWMRDTGGGAVIHISSIAALEAGWPPAYAAAKAALISHSKSLAVSLAPDRIRVNVVTPGAIEFSGGGWESTKHTNREVYDGIVSTIPWGRMGTPEEVADAVVFLASDRAGWITGACLTVDGGEHRGNL